MAALLIVTLLTAVLYLGYKAEAPRTQRPDTSAFERAASRIAVNDPAGPRDKIPAGFPGSIRYVPFDTIPEYFDDSINCRDDEHFFPASEEMGVDAEAVGWKYFPCACGKDYDGRYDHGENLQAQKDQQS